MSTASITTSVGRSPAKAFTGRDSRPCQSERVTGWRALAAKARSARLVERKTSHSFAACGGTRSVVRSSLASRMVLAAINLAVELVLPSRMAAT